MNSPFQRSRFQLLLDDLLYSRAASRLQQSPKIPTLRSPVSAGCLIMCLGCLGLGTMVIRGMSSPRADHAARVLSDDPYRVAETKDQPLANQVLVQVVVPEGATKADVFAWHREIVATYSHRGRPFVNYYRGSFDVSRMIATDAGGAEPLWYGH